ncbi:MAG: SpoIIE family protein phosphatase, partial [Bacteroidia bacterium]|nr:SpoIIE family protein phosphatase [Bacteroidia bacterium]
NTLNQIHTEKHISNPGEMLTHLNNQIKDSLKQNSQKAKQRDGMDLSLIKINLKENKLKFAGANRPLYLVRNKEVIEYKATKHAIGGFTDYNKLFEEVEIDLLSGDFICLATDGYADQFGGIDGKKFMTKNFKKLLVNISDLKAYEQQKYLNETFEAWRGPHEQVDDVCVVGIKI